jgi:hypothetical protein
MNVSQGTQDILDISFGESYIDDGELLSNCVNLLPDPWMMPAFLFHWRHQPPDTYQQMRDNESQTTRW